MDLNPNLNLNQTQPQPPAGEPAASIPVRAWWKEGYVWLVISGPLSAVIACAVTAVYIWRGPDAVVPENRYAGGIAISRQVQSAKPAMQPAQMGRNHSATGGSVNAGR